VECKNIYCIEAENGMVVAKDWIVGERDDFLEMLIKAYNISVIRCYCLAIVCPPKVHVSEV
jgi:hypothetical protein